MSVDFPEPDEPITATNSPRSIWRLTPRNAWTSTSPSWYTFQTSSQMISAPIAL